MAVSFIQKLTLEVIRMTYFNKHNMIDQVDNIVDCERITYWANVGRLLEVRIRY